MLVAEPTCTNARCCFRKWVACIAFFCLCLNGCGHSKPVASERSSSPQVTVLLDVISSELAFVELAIDDGQWLIPDARLDILRPLFELGVSFVPLLPTQGDPLPGVLGGELSVDCREVVLAMKSSVEAFGYVAVGAAVTPYDVETLDVTSEHRFALKKVMPMLDAEEIAASIQAVFSVNLDDNEIPEIFIQSTHPDLYTNFGAYSPSHHSLILLIPDGDVSKVSAVGFHGGEAHAAFVVAKLGGIADLDADGAPDVIVKWFHHEGRQTEVFRYLNGQLESRFQSVSGEGTCAK